MKNIIFDLSEVLLPGLIGVEDILEKELGASSDDIAKAMGSYPYHKVGNILEEHLKGKISYTQYREKVFGDLALSDKLFEVFDRTCVSMFDKPYVYTEELLKTVSKSHRIFLLSDHFEVWADYIKNKHPFFSYFEDLLWSFQIKETKKSEGPFKFRGRMVSR